jgi:hypothetical protein
LFRNQTISLGWWIGQKPTSADGWRRHMKISGKLKRKDGKMKMEADGSEDQSSPRVVAPRGRKEGNNF